MDDTEGLGRKISPEKVAEMRDYVISGGAVQRSTKFQKGQSGNPKGRPKKADKDKSQKSKPALTSRYGESVAATLRKIVKVRKAGDMVEMATLDALIEVLTQEAFKGNTHAARTLIDEYRREEVREAKKAAEDYEFWKQHCAQARLELLDADRQGLPKPTLSIHPDDIEFGPGHKVTFVGPFGKEMQSAVRDAALDRDYYEAFWGRCIWEWYHQRPKPRGDMPMFVHSLYYFCMERLLPKRLRRNMDVEEWVETQKKLSAHESYRAVMKAGYYARIRIPDRGEWRRHIIPDAYLPIFLQCDPMHPEIILDALWSAQVQKSEMSGKDVSEERRAIEEFRKNYMENLKNGMKW